MSTIPAAFIQTVMKSGSLEALVDGIDGARHLTYSQYADQVARVTTGLRELGPDRGDRIAFLLNNCVEFHIADLAAQFAGLVPLSIYTASTSDQLRFILENSGAKVLITDAAFLETVRAASKGMNLIVVVIGDSRGAVGWQSLLKNESSDLHADAALVKPDDLATIIYTSGTSGPPKGVMLTQANVFLNAFGYIERAGVDVTGQRMVSYLPMAHIAERIVSFYAPAIVGQTVWPCARVPELPAYLKSVRPQALFGVPLIWERLQSAIEGRIAENHRLDRVFQWSFRSSGSWLPVKRQLARLTLRMIAWRVRESAGLNSLRYASSGGAGVDPAIVAWFQAVGVPLTESYGMSESTGPMTWTPGAVRTGASGQAMPGVAVRIAKDGEILCQGPTVFAGYWADDLKTKEVIRDGWLHTGDLGKIDRKGYVSVLGRKKDIIVTRGGENFSPANIESALTSYTLIANACVVGDSLPYLATLIVLDEQEVRKWFDREGIAYTSLPAAAGHERTIAAIGQIVDAVNGEHSKGERLRRFKVLDHTWENNFDLLTPTLKPKRKAILERYGAEIDLLYR